MGDRVRFTKDPFSTEKANVPPDGALGFSQYLKYYITFPLFLLFLTCSIGTVVITFDHAKKVGVQFDDFEEGHDLESVLSTTEVDPTSAGGKRNGYFCDVSRLKVIKNHKKPDSIIAIEVQITELVVLKVCSSLDYVGYVRASGRVQWPLIGLSLESGGNYPVQYST